MARKFRRNDIVCEKDGSRGFWPGRVWKRLDVDHVIVVDCGKHVTIYHEEDLMLTDYRGRWRWLREPDNPYGKTPVWSHFTSLRQLKKQAAQYNAHFGGRHAWGERWTKEEREAAISTTPIFGKDDHD